MRTKHQDGFVVAGVDGEDLLLIGLTAGAVRKLDEDAAIPWVNDAGGRDVLLVRSGIGPEKERALVRQFNETRDPPRSPARLLLFAPSMELLERLAVGRGFLHMARREDGRGTNGLLFLIPPRELDDAPRFLGRANAVLAMSREARADG